MGAPANVEHEASIFLQKLIEDGTDEPTKLASRLFVVGLHVNLWERNKGVRFCSYLDCDELLPCVQMCQHMKMNNRDQTFAYQVIYR